MRKKGHYVSRITYYSMIYGIGIDSAENERFARLLTKNRRRLLAQLFNTYEAAAFADLSAERTPRYIAGRWAAKEAVLKALGTGIGPISLPEVGIFASDAGVPFIKLYGRAAAYGEQYGIVQWHLSITHNNGTATAFAIAERNL